MTDRLPVGVVHGQKGFVMMTFQGMMMRTQMMMDIIHYRAVEETYRKWQDATRNYYEQGYDHGETVKLYKELISLGADPEKLFDEDFRIRDEVAMKGDK